MNLKNIAKALVTGKIAGLATASAVLACAASEGRKPVSAINAVSHIVWDEAAFHQTTPSVKYTFTGLALNVAACVSWAVVQELLFGRSARRSPASALAAGTATSLLAYLTDYHGVPKRLTPGFEKHLSNRSLLVVYIVLALSLAASNAAQHSCTD